MANANAPHHYDANRTTADIVQRTLTTLNLTEATDDRFAAQVFVFDRHPEASADFNQYFPPDDPKQAQFDQQFRQRMQASATRQPAKTIIIDGKNPNEALNIACLPTSDRYLAFGSWGTFANTCGQTLAIAKLLLYAKNPAAQRQLLLEAIAHDVFCIGYAAAQDQNSPLRQALRQQGLNYLHKDPPAYQLEEIPQVFSALNIFVDQQMQTHMPSRKKTEFVVIPQLWRIFESQVLLKEGSLSVAGVYRQDLPPKTFNPFTQIPEVKALALKDL